MADSSVPRRRTRENPLHMIGARFGRWLVLGYNGVADERGAKFLSCQCDCGAVREVRAASLRSGSSQGCGCTMPDAVRARSTKHGMSSRKKNIRLNGYGQWIGMRSRCRNPNDPSYDRYGGRGIDVYDEWFESIDAFMAYIGPRPSMRHTIDRIDNDKGYVPGNVRWATHVEQGRNRRTNRVVEYGGMARCVTEWATLLGIKAKVIFDRLNDGWPAERALRTPVRPRAKSCR